MSIKSLEVSKVGDDLAELQKLADQLGLTGEWWLDLEDEGEADDKATETVEALKVVGQIEDEEVVPASVEEPDPAPLSEVEAQFATELNLLTPHGLGFIQEQLLSLEVSVFSFIDLLEDASLVGVFDHYLLIEDQPENNDDKFEVIKVWHSFSKIQSALKESGLDEFCEHFFPQELAGVLDDSLLLHESLALFEQYAYYIQQLKKRLEVALLPQDKEPLPEDRLLPAKGLQAQLRFSLHLDQGFLPAHKTERQLADELVIDDLATRILLHVSTLDVGDLHLNKKKTTQLLFSVDAVRKRIGSEAVRLQKNGMQSEYANQLVNRAMSVALNETWRTGSSVLALALIGNTIPETELKSDWKKQLKINRRLKRKVKLAEAAAEKRKTAS